MAYDDIYNRYKNLYTAQDNALKQKRDSQLQAYNNQQSQLNNQYTDLINSIKQKLGQNEANYNSQKTDIANKYQNMYSQFDNQNTDANNKNYTDKNNVDVGVNQNLNRVRELMARNGWTGGGENLQAQLSSNTDRMNGFGKADTNLTSTLQTILNNRNQSKAQEVSDNNNLYNAYTSQMNDYNNQIGADQREQTQKLQSIIDAINQTNANYNSDSQSAKATLDAQQEQEVYNRQQQEQAAQKAAQQAATRATSSRSSGSRSTASSSGQNMSDLAWQELSNQNAKGTDYTWLMKNKASLVRDVGQAQWDQMKKAVLDDSAKKAQAANLVSRIRPME